MSEVCTKSQDEVKTMKREKMKSKANKVKFKSKKAKNRSMKYYRTLAEAERRRMSGGRIYYKVSRGYYIVYPKSRGWFDW